MFITSCMQHLLNFYINVMCLLLFFSFAVLMHFIHELLARILRATLIPRYDFNKLIDWLGHSQRLSTNAIWTLKNKFQCFKKLRSWLYLYFCLILYSPVMDKYYSSQTTTNEGLSRYTCCSWKTKSNYCVSKVSW